ncbi:MAG: Holliday junction resolvase RuvX [Ruminococcaceae bacterium]|nr:Holliday junction resolvase RuvX [Oscillospiraceae bacterium]
MSSKGKILGVDFGESRCGIAISDSLGFLANGLKTLKVTGLNNLAEDIRVIAEENSVKLIVMGHPVNMNGTLGEKSEKVKAFAERLSEHTGLEVVLFDERCTTMAAHQYLNETNTRGAKRKAVVDTLSAQIILQNYLDSHK